MAAKKTPNSDNLSPIHLVSILGWILTNFDDDGLVTRKLKGGYDQFSLVYEDQQGNQYLFQNVLVQ